VNVILEVKEVVEQKFRAFTKSREQFSSKRLSRQDYFIFYKWLYSELIARIPAQIHRIRARSPHLGNSFRLSMQRAR
jgi:hypothetical protein